MRRWLKRASAAVLIGAVAYVAVGAVAAWRLTARSRPASPEPAPAHHEGLRLRASDGVSIGAWWHARASPRAVAVVAHGKGSSRTAQRGVADALHAAGCATLAISLRAHGDSGGDRSDLGLRERLDVVAAVEEARRRAPGVPVIVYGASLGAAAALFAAEELGARVDGYVLVGAFPDLRVAVRRRTRRYLPWGLEALAYGSLRAGAVVAFPALDEVRPEVAARGVPRTAEVLLIAGDRDDRAPPEDARRIARAVGHAEVALARGVDHEDLRTIPDRAVWARVEALILRVGAR